MSGRTSLHCPQRKTWARDAFRRALTSTVYVVMQFGSSLRKRSVQPRQCRIPCGRAKVVDDDALRRVIHKRDQRVIKMSRWAQNSRLSPAGLEVPAVLDQEAVRHSRVQAKASISISDPIFSTSEAARRLGTTVGNTFNRLPHWSVGNQGDITAETDHEEHLDGTVASCPACLKDILRISQ